MFNQIKLFSACLAAVLLMSTGLRAQDFNSVSTDVDSQLQASLKELADIRAKIAEEKIPLSKEINELEKQVLQKTREAERLLKVRDSRTIALDDLRKQVKSLEDINKYISDRLVEYVNNLNSQMAVSERQKFGQVLDAAKNAPADVNIDESERLQRQVAVVDMALDRLDDQLGGFSFSGSALSSESVLKEGTFIAIGPSLFFVSKDGTAVGLIEDRINVADPVVVSLPASFTPGLVELAESGQGAFPADASEGKAIMIEKQRESYFEHIQKGQIVGYVILSLGVIAVLLGLFKMVEIGGFAECKPKDVQDTLDLLADGKPEAALERAREVKGEAGEMLVQGVTHYEDKRGVIEEIMFERILKARPRLERFLPFLAITAAAAPLLGLLGTVIGMIKTFNLITIFGTGDARSLSTGISEALVTTELGLTVAIPVLILHGMLSRYAKRKLATMEESAVGYVNGISTMK